MSDVTQILNRIESGDTHASGQLLPLVYDELRKLASHRLAQEKPGQTLQATALVHEAYLRLVGAEGPQWDGRGHFFAAAAEAMRRILVENARRKNAAKHGGQHRRIELNDELIAPGQKRVDDVLEIDSLLDQLAAVDARAAQLVKLRYFAGLTGDQSAAVLGISPRSADLVWAYARAWLFERLQRDHA